MESSDTFLKNLSAKLPDTCRTCDLVRVGLYRSDQAAAAARRRGDSPPFYQMNGRVILYAKEEVIEFIRSKRKSPKKAICLIKDEG